MKLIRTEFILFVADQQRSTEFYTALLERKPVLDVSGMTEFDLDGCTLGLMPANGIARIISPSLPHPSGGAGIPRCEVYLLVDDLDSCCRIAEQCHARFVSAAADRDWGHRVAYFADPDGHVVAFAQPIRP